MTKWQRIRAPRWVFGWRWMFGGMLASLVFAITDIAYVSGLARAMRFVFLVGWLVVALSERREAANLDGPQKKLRLFVALFVVFSGLTVAWSVSPVVSLENWLVVAAMFAIILTATTGRWMDTHCLVEDVRILFWFIVGVCALGYLLVAMGALPLHGMGDRFQGIFANPNDLGLLAMNACFLGPLLFSLTRNSLYLWISLIPLASVLQSGTRSALVGLVGGLVIALMARGARDRRLLTHRLLPGCFAAVAAAFAIQSVAVKAPPGSLLSSVGRFAKLSSAGDVLNGRQLAWHDAWTLVLQRPFQGHGWRASEVLFSEARSAGTITFPLNQVHNSYLQLVVEIGIIGAILFALLLSRVVWDLWRLQPSGLWFWLQAAVIMNLITFVTESKMFVVGAVHSWVFWILVGILSVVVRKQFSAQSEGGEGALAAEIGPDSTNTPSGSLMAADDSGHDVSSATIDQCEPAVSIILPIFNSMTYLDECLRSLEVQCFRDFEIVVVDDFSSDESMTYIRRFFKDHPELRVRYVIHARNHGIGVARSSGVAAATGRFVTFIDSDDRAHPSWLTTMMELASSLGDGNTIVAVDAESFISSSGEIVDRLQAAPVYGELISPPEAIDQLLRGDMMPHMWNKLFPAQLLSAGSMSQARLMEDLSTVLSVVAVSSGVVAAPGAQYGYRLRDDSLSSGTGELEDRRSMVEGVLALFQGEAAVPADSLSLLAFGYRRIYLNYITVQAKMDRGLRDLRSEARHTAQSMKVSECLRLAFSDRWLSGSASLLLKVAPDVYGLLVWARRTMGSPARKRLA